MRYCLPCGALLLAGLMGVNACSSDGSAGADAGTDAMMNVPDGGSADGDGGTPDGGGGGRVPPSIAPGATDRFLLRGTILEPAGPLVGELLVEGNSITCVAASCSTQAGATGATIITTSGIIMPGMIDAHNHGLFNIFDEGDWNPGKFYQNHNDWTSDVRYGQMLDAKQYLNSEITSPVDLRCEIDKYAEIKALIAGTTSFLLAGGAQQPACYASLARTIDTNRNDLGMDKVQTAISIPSSNAAAQAICDNFADGSTNSFVVHVGEGLNASALNEWNTLKSRASGCLIAPQTAVVHGTAFGTAEFTEMATANMKLVWSPKSNLFLYNDTARIDLAIQAGLKTIALAPDWSLGGSVNLLDELRTAAQVNKSKFNNLLTSKRLFEMVTIDAARVLGVEAQIGSLEVGKRADIVLLAGDPQTPYDAIIQSRPMDVELVMLDGRALYGAPVLKPAAPATPGCEDLPVCQVSKFLCVAESSTADKLNQTYGDITQVLISNLAAYDALVAPMSISPFSPLAPLLKCQ